MLLHKLSDYIVMGCCMADLSHYKETKIYRRIKYFIFSIITAAIAYVVTFIAEYFLPSLLTNLYTFSVSWLPNNASVVTEIYNYLHQQSPEFYTIVFLGFFLIIWRVIHNSILGGMIGRLFTAFQRLQDSGHFASGGNARFAGMLEEYQAKNKQGIYYGRSLFSRFWFMKESNDRHMLTIAGAGSGKGACAIIPNLLEWNGSVLCIDPKGTNAYVTAARRRKLGNKVYVIDPFNTVTTEDAACFNPLDIVDLNSLTVVEDIRLISEALVPAEPDSKNIHFTESARAMIDGYIVHVLTSGDYEYPSLNDVFEIIYMPLNKSIDVYSKMDKNTSCGGMAHQAADRFLKGMDKNEFASVEATLKSNIKWLASEAFKTTIAQSSFSFEEMKNQKTSVYLVIPPDMLSTHRTFLRLFINVASSRYTRGGKAKIQGLFIIDECPALGYMAELEKVYAVLRSYNMVMWTFFQDKGQLDDLYGSRARTFITSSRAVQVFAIGDEDADWVASMIGTRGKVAESGEAKTVGITDFRNAGSVSTEIGGQEGLQYILKIGSPSLLLERRPYHKSYTFAPLASRDPDHPWPSFQHTIGKLFERIKTYTIVLIPILFFGGLGLGLLIGIINPISDIHNLKNIAFLIGKIVLSLFAIIIAGIVLSNLIITWLSKRYHRQYLEEQRKDQEKYPERLAFYADREYLIMRKQIVYSFAIPDWVPISKYHNFPPELIHHSLLVNLHNNYSNSRTMVGDLLVNKHNQDEVNYLIEIVERNTKALDTTVEKTLRGELNGKI